MQTTGNTILITGGGSGIGRGLAEAFHELGNKIIIAGRRQQALDEVTAAHPGMEAVRLDVQDAAGIARFASDLSSRFPALNVVVHNAGISRPEAIGEADPQIAEEVLTTNLLAPIRLTSALLPALRKQPHGAILTVTSGLAFVPLAGYPTYCASKAALHSWTESLRFQLRKTKIQVLEIAPPYVQTELGGARQASDPRAMPLKDFIAETMEVLKKQPDANEVLVEAVKPMRYVVEKGTGAYEAFFTQMNKQFAGE